MLKRIVRDNIFNKFNKIFGLNIAKNIELSIYNFSIDYAENNNTPFLLENIYNEKANELYCLLNNNLQTVINAIKDNKIDIKNIANIRPSELNILLSNKQYIDIIKKKELNMILQEKKASTAFECKKCKKKKCSITEKQVRSADEPATQFITCLECGHVFTL